MAQAMITKRKLEEEEKENKEAKKEIKFELSNTRFAKIYHSELYSDTVLSLNINKGRSFIITRNMWNKIKENSDIIDNEFNKNV